MDPIRPPSLVKKIQKKYFLNPFLGHFQKSVTGSENMCRSWAPKTPFLYKGQQKAIYIKHYANSQDLKDLKDQTCQKM